MPSNQNQPLILHVSWVSAHGRSTITPYFLLSWVLTRCTGCLLCAKLCIKLVSRVNAQSRLWWLLNLNRHHWLAHLYTVLVKAVVLPFNITEASYEPIRYYYIKLVTLIPQFSCLLLESMHNRANCWPHLKVCVAAFNGTCLNTSALRRAGVQKLPGRLPCMIIRI